MLRYSVATALFQEVNLLNRYVKDAARRRHYDPYVVRMQITLLPRAHREPYDAYTTVAFFHQQSKPACGPPAAGKGQAVAAAPAAGSPAEALHLASLAPPQAAQLAPSVAPATARGGRAADLCGRVEDGDDAGPAWSPGEDADDDGAAVAAKDEWRDSRRQQDDAGKWREGFGNMQREQQDKVWQACVARAGTLAKIPMDKLRDCREANDLKTLADGLLTASFPDRQGEGGARVERLMACTRLAEAEAKLIDGEAETPVVVPLMVTDDVESALHSAAEERIRDLAFSIAALVNGFGGSAAVKKVTDQLQSSLGHDYNSLLTVARLADNTYRVRLGAMQQITSAYAMVPRTHNITFLLLVPHLERDDTPHRGRYRTGGDAIDLISRTSFVNTITGEQLQRRNVGPDLTSLRATLGYYRRYGRDFSLLTDGEPLLRLLVLLTQNRSTEFFRALDLVSPAPVMLKQAAWMDLASDLEDSRYGLTAFELPDLPRPSLFGSQTALLFDDAKQSAQVTLRGGRHLRSDDLYATLTLPLHVKPAPPPAPGAKLPAAPPQVFPRVRLAAQKIDVDATASATTSIFPSVASWRPDDQAILEVFCKSCKADRGHGAAAVAAAGDPLVERASTSADRAAAAISRACYAALVLKKDDPEKPDFDVLIPARVVLADAAGRGALAIDVDNHVAKPASSPVHFQVEGGQITDVSYSGSGALDPAARTVTTGEVRLGLQNLDPSTPLKVTTWKEKPPKNPGDRPTKVFTDSATVVVRLAVPVEVAHEH
jgi:hypothetical protein